MFFWVLNKNTKDFNFMVINWYGEGCFKFQNGEVSLLTDLPDQTSGISAPRIGTNIMLKTITAWPTEFGEDTKADKTIFGAGEYDAKDVKIKGFQLKEESAEKYFKTIYVIKWEDMSIGFLGHISGDVPTNAMENFEELDVLIGPVGGTPFMDIEKINRLVKVLNPKIFIPSFYKISGLKRKSGELKDFLDKFGGEVEKDLDKFVFKKKDTQDLKKTKIVCFKI